ncbi:SRPBCC domain-containing protein [Yoonia sp. R2331]|uniref:SRPBCC family protein n=1 Tax=Yoonia sp. R2331 TaxID=3237238 RepID=UPI0034E56832
MSDTQIWARIERTFDAAIDAVWAMWTDPAMFQKWYGPMGMTVPMAEMDVRVGGTRKIAMEMVTPDRTMKMYFTGVYKEVNPTSRLVYTEAMCDADGTLIPPSQMGMPEGTPDITEVIVELRAEGDKTAMTMVHVGVPAGSPGEGGWNQAIDKLEAMLAA